jgi:hypothetical protein
MMIQVDPVNNPRKEDGGFGPVHCECCNKYSSAYVRLEIDLNPRLLCAGCITITLCKSCLIDWVNVIDKTILKDCIEKGRAA